MGRKERERVKKRWRRELFRGVNVGRPNERESKGAKK
jgi:hypothetical protein